MHAFIWYLFHFAHLVRTWSHSFFPPIHTNEVAYFKYHISAITWKWVAPVFTVFVKRMGGEMPDG